MTTLDKLNKGRSSTAGRLKCFLVSTLVPNYLRRAILMCSLAAVLTKVDRCEYEGLAAQVCDELSLDYAYGHAAMVSPMQWSSRIWAGLPPIDMGNQKKGPSLFAIAKQIFANVPRYLVYASDRIMLEDIYRTLRTIIPRTRTA